MGKILRSFFCQSIWGIFFIAFTFGAGSWLVIGLQEPQAEAIGNPVFASISGLSAQPLEKRLAIRTELAELDVLGRDTTTKELIVRAAPKVLLALSRQGINVTQIHSVFSETQNLEGYFNPDTLREKLESIAMNFPDVVAIEEVGKTHQGRPILAAVIQSTKNDKTIQENETYRPTVLFNGMHHARELMTAEVSISIIETLAEGSLNDPEVQDWLSKYRIVVIPQVNPDGNNLVHNGQRFWRKNAWEEKDSVVGVDLNRNYPSLWGACNGSSGSKWSDTYRGPAAGSEPETQAMIGAVEKYKPAFNISYHSYSELIIFPFGCSNIQNPAREFFANVGQNMNENIINDSGKTGQYEVGTAPELLYNADGSDLDWQWSEHGVYAYTIEVNASSQGFQPDYTRWRNKTVAGQMGGWKTLIRRLGGSSITAQVNLSGIAQEHASENNRVSYSLEKIEKSAQGPIFVPFAPVPEDSEQENQEDFTAKNEHGPVRFQNKTFSLRDQAGTLFQMVDSGTYRIHFWAGPNLLLSQTVEVNERPVDLGLIALKPSETP